MTSTPRTWVAGEVVTATELNTEIRDQFNSIIGAWTAYTPTITASSGTVTLGTGSAAAGRYLQVGKTLHLRFRFNFGTSGNSYGTGVYRISLPPSLTVYSDVDEALGAVRINDSSVGSAGYYFGSVVATSGATYLTMYAGNGAVTNTQPFTVDNGDIFMGSIQCEVQ